MEILKEDWVQNILNDKDNVLISPLNNEQWGEGSNNQLYKEVDLFVDDNIETLPNNNIINHKEEDFMDNREQDYNKDKDDDYEDEDEDDDEDEEDDIDELIKKEYAKTINLYFLYVSNDLMIRKIITEKVDLTEDGILKKELLLYLIQSKKKNRYKLFEILLYQPLIDEINDKIDNKLDNPSYLKIVPIVNPVQLNVQVKLFHSTNAVYILLKEIDIMEKQTEYINDRKIYKKVPYKKYTRKIKYLTNSSNSLLNDNKNKTRKNVSFNI